MALVFKVNDTRIYPIVNTTITERVGTFSDGSLPLEISSVRECFLPMSQLTIEDTETNSKWFYVIVADDVERVSKSNELCYRHNLTVRSGIYESKKHILRNTVFSQPPRISKATCNQMLVAPMLFNSTEVCFFYPDGTDDKCSHFDLKLSKRTKIASAKLKLHTILYEYPQGNSALDNPTRFDNRHKSITIEILRDDSISVDEVIMTDGETEHYIDPINFGSSFDNDTTIKIRVIGNVYINPNSYANQAGVVIVQAELELETYYYSLYDVVETLRKQSLKTYNNVRSLELDCLLLNNADKVNELKKIVAPELSFNGMTYYDALYQTLSYIDAIPVVDSNGHLSYEYLNDYSGQEIDLTDKRADERISINDEYYTNKLVANYQNGRQEIAISYPSNNKKCRVGAKQIGIPEQSSSYVLIVPKPIDYIDKLVITTGTLHFDVKFLYYDNGHYDKTFKNLYISELEMQDRTLETMVYSVLNDNREFYQETKLLCNCLCYSRGSNYIDLLDHSALTYLTHDIYKYAIMAQLSFSMGIASNSTIGTYDGNKTIEITNMEGVDSVESDICSKQDIHFKIQYHALFDGRVEQVSTKEKYEGESFVAQDSAEVSLNRMGNNLQGLIAKVGNETENVTFDVTSYGSRVQLGSIWENSDHERYLANVVQTTFSTDLNKVIINAQFTKNFNLLSQFTKIDQQKRFYQISERLTSKGYENITEYVYFSYSEPYSSLYEKSAIVSDLFLQTLIGDTLLATSEQYKSCYATFVPYTNEDDIASAINGRMYIPLHTYGSGNSICFEMDYEEQINAGNRLTGEGTGDNPYYTKSTLYTESNGFADKVNIEIWNDTYYGDSDLTYNENFPLIASNNDEKVININEFYYYKKPNEIFHLNFALAFMSYGEDEFFFGDKFINNNAVIPNAILSRMVRFSYGNNIYSIIDNKNINSNIVNCTVTTSIEEIGDKKYLRVGIGLLTAITECKSWALIDENNNVLIASNKHMENFSSIIFYVIPRRNRI